MSRNSLSNSSLLGREEEQGWPWVWELIGRPRPETRQRLRIRVADTVMFREGYPRTWVFTSKTGDVLRKAPDKLKNELIKEHLLRTAVEHNNRVAAVERRGRPSSPPRRKGPGGRARMLSEDEVSGLLKAEGGGGLLDGMLARLERTVAMPSRVGRGHAEAIACCAIALRAPAFAQRGAPRPGTRRASTGLQGSKRADLADARGAAAPSRRQRHPAKDARLQAMQARSRATRRRGSRAAAVVVLSKDGGAARTRSFCVDIALNGDAWRRAIDSAAPARRSGRPRSSATHRRSSRARATPKLAQDGEAGD